MSGKRNVRKHERVSLEEARVGGSVLYPNTSECGGSMTHS
jgi:hypothetical protein